MFLAKKVKSPWTILGTLSSQKLHNNLYMCGPTIQFYKCLQRRVMWIMRKKSQINWMDEKKSKKETSHLFKISFQFPSPVPHFLLYMINVLGHDFCTARKVRGNLLAGYLSHMWRCETASKKMKKQVK